MTDHEFFKLLKDKKIADAYQYYDSSRYKLALARISYEALNNDVELSNEELLQKNNSDTIINLETYLKAQKRIFSAVA